MMINVELIVLQETPVTGTDDSTEKILLTIGHKNQKCFRCGKIGRISKDYRTNNSRSKLQEQKVCFQCGKPGHISKFWKSGKNLTNREENGNNDAGTTMMAELTAIAMSDNIGCQKWISDSGCTRHITNGQDHLLNFKNENGTTKIGDNDYIESMGYGKMKLVAAVDGKLNE